MSTIMACAAYAESFYKQVINKPVGQLVEVKSFPEYEKVPVWATSGKDASADIRLYVEASNPAKNKFAIFNIAVTNNKNTVINTSFQAIFYNAEKQVIGVAHLGGAVEQGKTRSFIAGMQYIPPELLKEIKSCDFIYYEW